MSGKNIADSQSLLRALAVAIRQHRKALGMSQEGLAESSDLHRTYISDIERGTRNISISNLQRIAMSLGITTAKLVSDAEELQLSRTA